MKRPINILFGLGILLLFDLTLVGQVTAQTFTNLYSFTGGTDGANPYAGLILSGDTLYGTAADGGSYGQGTVFKLNTNGTGFVTVHSFNPSSPGAPEGSHPQGDLVLSGDILYGTTTLCTTFKVNTDGTTFTPLSCGYGSYAGLVLSSDTLYGTMSYGCIAKSGSVFSSDLNGQYGFIYCFCPTVESGVYTNNDGATPYAGLLLSGATLYGTTSLGGTFGGPSSGGTVFGIGTDGTGFTNLHNFSGRDGTGPYAGLMQLGDTLYGTTLYGGSSNVGTVFALSTNGTAFTTLYNFKGGADGAYPKGRLTSLGNTLYGTTSGGGNSGNGTVFALHIDGRGFSTLHSFGAAATNLSGLYTNSDGVYPEAGLLLSGNALYGTAEGGGSLGYGTAFSILLPPKLTIIPFATNIILTWPTNITGTLQSTTNLGSSAVWTTNLPSPVVVNGENTVTNPITGSQQFYRLAQ